MRINIIIIIIVACSLNTFGQIKINGAWNEYNIFCIPNLNVKDSICTIRKTSLSKSTQRKYCYPEAIFKDMINFIGDTSGYSYTNYRIIDTKCELQKDSIIYNFKYIIKEDSSVQFINEKSNQNIPFAIKNNFKILKLTNQLLIIFNGSCFKVYFKNDLIVEDIPELKNDYYILPFFEKVMKDWGYTITYK